ncbi:MAG: 50S ribosomal protein L9 [Acidobacteriota bacterium]|nr:50S ribosomal protein L9 [Acidobacteriota bacterium]
MKIILQENLEKLGTRGEIVEVAEGYARNYLLPRKIALPATPGNLKQLERIRTRLAKIEAQEHATASQAAAAISGATISFERKAGQTDQLFGSVTAADIAEALAAQGIEVDKRKVALAEPIKVLGEYDVAIKLHHNVAANIKVVVTREGGPLEPAPEAKAEAAPAAEPASEPAESAGE